MLNYVKGDLVKACLLGEVDAAAHQCNCFCRMGRGIAPQFAKAFPDLERVDSQTKRGDRDKMGGLTFIYDGVLIANLYGQYHWNALPVNTDYQALDTALWSFRSLIDAINLFSENKIETIGFPKLGCGLAGGDWSKVSQLIDSNFSDMKVFIYTLD